MTRAAPSANLHPMKGSPEQDLLLQTGGGESSGPWSPGPACLPAQEGTGSSLSGQCPPERPLNLGSPASTTCAGEGGSGDRRDPRALSELLQEPKTSGGQAHAAPTDAPRAWASTLSLGARGLSHEPRSSSTKDTFSRRDQWAGRVKHSWPARELQAPTHAPGAPSPYGH